MAITCVCCPTAHSGRTEYTFYPVLSLLCRRSTLWRGCGGPPPPFSFSIHALYLQSHTAVPVQQGQEPNKGHKRRLGMLCDMTGFLSLSFLTLWPRGRGLLTGRLKRSMGLTLFPVRKSRLQWEGRCTLKRQCPGVHFPSGEQHTEGAWTRLWVTDIGRSSYSPSAACELGQDSVSEPSFFMPRREMT